ncbi:MAG TPA: nitrilase-related carbon-nitrogen hydrolase, partial [Methyloradius sp.]
MSESIRLAIAQINCTVGDMAGNSAKIVASALQAVKSNASLLITPELSLCGYPPEDLLLRDDFLLICEIELQKLAAALPDITVLVGHPHKENGNCYNAASVLQGGKVVATYHKHILPNHSVFDEVRYFSTGKDALVFEHAGVQFGVLICADVWEVSPAKLAKQAGAEV